MNFTIVNAIVIAIIRKGEITTTLTQQNINNKSVYNLNFALANGRHFICFTLEMAFTEI